MYAFLHTLILKRNRACRCERMADFDGPKRAGNVPNVSGLGRFLRPSTVAAADKFADVRSSKGET
jgi:hypothetical protein